eukprot:CFRG4079T1
MDSNLDGIPASCPDGPQWIFAYFGECVVGWQHTLAFYIGLSSIGFWLFAQAPQMLSNYRNGNAESLSLLFLCQWLIGDALNLIGARMTHQLATQIITAYYFVIVDMLMIMQFTYYTVKSTLESHNSRKPSANNRMYQASASLLLLVTIGALAIKTAMALHVDGTRGNSASNGVGRSLLSVDVGGIQMTQTQIGYGLGIASAAFYLSSRIPQIIKNIKRRSTGGLAFTMFLLAVMGNVTYSLSIFITSCDSDFLLKKLPWIVGSLGTIVFDMTIFAQFWIFGDRTAASATHVRDRSLSRSSAMATHMEANGERRPLLLPIKNQTITNRIELTRMIRLSRAWLDSNTASTMCLRFCEQRLTMSMNL